MIENIWNIYFIVNFLSSCGNLDLTKKIGEAGIRRLSGIFIDGQYQILWWLIVLC